MITILTPFGKSNNGGYHVWLRHTVKCHFQCQSLDFCMRYKWRSVTTTSNSVAYFFFECFVVAFALYAFYEYMFLRRIIETKFVPSVLVHYEKHSDNESSDERKINVQQIFVCIINHIGKTLCVFSIYTSFVV